MRRDKQRKERIKISDVFVKRRFMCIDEETFSDK